MKNKLLILLIGFAFVGCGTPKYNLENIESKKVLYDVLPEEVKSIYKFYVLNNALTFDIVAKSLDDNYEISYKYSGEGKPYLLEVANSDEVIIINNNEFVMTNGYGGHPFVLYNKVLYMAYELNLDKVNYSKSEYIVIDLSEKLK